MRTLRKKHRSHVARSLPLTVHEVFFGRGFEVKSYVGARIRQLPPRRLDMHLEKMMCKVRDFSNPVVAGPRKAIREKK